MIFYFGITINLPFALNKTFYNKKSFKISYSEQPLIKPKIMRERISTSFWDWNLECKTLNFESIYFKLIFKVHLLKLHENQQKIQTVIRVLIYHRFGFVSCSRQYSPHWWLHTESETWIQWGYPCCCKYPDCQSYLPCFFHAPLKNRKNILNEYQDNEIRHI